jgi:hypothetical protein
MIDPRAGRVLGAAGLRGARPAPVDAARRPSHDARTPSHTTARPDRGTADWRDIPRNVTPRVFCGNTRTGGYAHLFT